jgi:hypothetical protein
MNQNLRSVIKARIQYAFLSICIVFSTLLLSSCKRLVAVGPPVTGVNGENVYLSDETASAVLTGIYINMSGDPLSNGNYPNSFMNFFPELSADELTLFDPAANATYTAYYTNKLINTTAPNLWLNTYPIIFVINSAIEGLTKSVSLTPVIKQQLLGEAEFMRAFCYFYLVNLYGDVPLVTTTNYKVNSVIHRTSQAQVYANIIADLRSAHLLLNTNYVYSDAMTPTSERTRPCQWAATALLARTYLYTRQWDSAAVQATSIINNSATYSLDSLNGVFLSNSSEAIWQLQPVQAGWNTQDAQLYIIPPTGPNGAWPVYLSPAMLNSFEIGDLRRVDWVDSTTAGGMTYYYPNKYKSATLDLPVTEYQMVLRLGEQYLIRAEAEAQQNDLAGAINDLNIVRNRAGLANTTAANQSDLLGKIQHERQVELFTEWGHRWMDLKRTGTVDMVMGTVSACAAKGGQWNTNDQWYPIALSELQLNQNLTQNDGY